MVLLAEPESGRSCAGPDEPGWVLERDALFGETVSEVDIVPQTDGDFRRGR